VVLLPAPFGPTINVICFGFAFSEIPRKMALRPKFFRMLCVEIMSGEHTRPRVLAMAPRHRELFLNAASRRDDHAESVSARAPKRAREARALPRIL
jgi:hypothetical protein